MLVLEAKIMIIEQYRQFARRQRALPRRQTGDGVVASGGLIKFKE
jgi:hypothetical protein